MAEKPSFPPTMITDMDIDSLSCCASYLTLRDISNMAMSCKYLNRAAYSDAIWKSLYSILPVITEIRQVWPDIGPLMALQMSSVREAFLLRHVAVRQFKYVDAMAFDTLIDGKPPQNMLFDKNGVIFSQGSSIRSLNISELEHRVSLAERGQHNARVTSMRLFSLNETSLNRNELDRDDSILITSSCDHFIRLWSKGGGRCFKGHAGPVSILSDKLLGDDTGKILASGGEDGTVRLWSINSSGKRGQHALKATLYGHEKTVSHISVAGHKTSLLVSISRNGKVKVWDTTAASSSIRSSCCVGMTSVPFGPVGMKCHESLLYVAAGSSVIAVDLRTMHRVSTLVLPDEIHSFAVLPSKSIFCTGGTSSAKMWDIRKVSDKVEPVAELDGHVGAVKSLHMDLHRVVTGGPDDPNVKIWDCNTGVETNCLFYTTPESSVGYSAIAVDGCRIVTAGVSDEANNPVRICIRDFTNATRSNVSSTLPETGSKFWDT